MDITQVEKDNALLIQRFLSEGDQGALNLLFSRYSGKVFAYLYTSLNDRSVASDVMQEVFCKALRSIQEGRYVDTYRFEAWLMRITHNAAMDFYRDRRRTRDLFAESTPSSAFSTSSDYDPERELTLSQSKKNLRRLIQKLPPAQRQVVIMRLYMGLSFQEIATHTDVSINTALGRMRYARLNMRRYAERDNLQLV